MTPADFLNQIIRPGLELLHELGGPKPSRDAERFMLAIAMQESGPQLNARYQNSPGSAGPAKGWWQFEQGGGVRGVLNHSSSSELARRACNRCAVVASDAAVHRALEGHDPLATIFARLLIMTEPKQLPQNVGDGWEQYMRLWRPGKPHPNNWPLNWDVATATV